MNVEDAYAQIARSWESGRLAHGYIVSGSLRESGFPLVDRLLQLILCTERDAPCGECRACRLAVDRGHPDVLWIEPQKRSRLISIDQIREAQGRIYQTSFTGGWKAGVIVAADRLGRGAANAFLKTLEEPPAKCVFFLLTDSPQFLLSTILSRCQMVALSGQEPRLDLHWEEYLVRILTDAVGRGGIGALGRADQVAGMLKSLRDEAEDEIRDGDGNDEANETIDARANALYRERRTRLIRSLLFWYRDILLLSAGENDKVIHFDKYLESLRERAGGMSARQALENVRVVEEMNRQLERNLPESTVLSMGFTRLR